MARNLIGLLWVSVWLLIAAPAYYDFETGVIGSQTWLAFGVLVFCTLMASWGYAAILSADPYIGLAKAGAGAGNDRLTKMGTVGIPCSPSGTSTPHQVLSEDNHRLLLACPHCNSRVILDLTEHQERRQEHAM